MAKYTHRIAVPASVVFDLESDNEVPTADEVDDAIGDLIDGMDIPEYDGGRVYLAEEAVEELPEENEKGNHLVLVKFSVEDTTENKQEVR